MTATLHNITTRLKDHPARRALLVDFTLDDGTQSPANVVLKEKGWSLYCLDQATRVAVFVKVPADCDLAATPFLRMAQFQHATQVLLVEWNALAGLAENIPLPENLIFVFNIGRSGTTLVSHMLGHVNGVLSLSEPNAHLDATAHRHMNGSELTRELIAASTRLLCRQPDGTVPETLAIKLYSQSLFNCADFHHEFPQAKYVFLYRDAVSWANSTFKMARGYGMPEVLDRDARDFIWKIATGANDIGILEASLPPSSDTYYHEDISAASWTLHLDAYVKNLEAGVPFMALRYNEMNSERENATRALLKHCGLPSSETSNALSGFEKDSQDGSGIGKDNKSEGYKPENVERFLRALKRQKRFQSPDRLLPDIYNRDRQIQ
jgi:Sulfotransferase domain